MGWYKDIQAILKQEPETWLAYIYGQQLENIPHLIRAKPRFRGVILRMCGYFFFLVRNVSSRQPTASKTKADYIVFAGTVNQMNSLKGTINVLKDNGKRVVEIAPSNLSRTQAHQDGCISMGFSCLDIVKSLVLLGRNVPSLYKQLQEKHPAAIRNYFNSFCSVYIYLVYFYRIIKQINPDFIITSNDHNPANRSFLAVAHHLGVKTVYMQHASVSRLFPALRVDYAFLDGQFALDTYRQCEENQPKTSRDVPTPKVFLTGQKKKLAIPASRETKTIGIALNALDNVATAIRFMKHLANAGYELRVRWHPGQAERHIQEYVTAFKDVRQIQVSNPRTESISDFMGSIRWLVAGNSSIHLEAALAGVTPIYFEMAPLDSPDYYGYVKHGLAKHARSAVEIVAMVQSGNSDGPDLEAVRYYSATYRTDWDGREGELVASYLLGKSQRHNDLLKENIAIF